ncbi:MAG: MarC family protein [Planctomycetes bacterium]|nr:MarC family protein [Planctomycetota bacterium]
MSFISAFITLCLVIDPFGSIPVILSLVPHVDNQRWQYRRVILREGLVALAVLVVFLLAGNRIMQAMHISQAALSAAGGTVLFIVAIRMIFPSRTGVFGGEEQQGEALIVPIAIPLIAGPSTMTTLMLMAARWPDRLPQWAAALLAAWALAMVTFLSAPFLSRLLGPRVLAAVERLMGMILVAVAVEMLITGARLAAGQT